MAEPSHRVQARAVKPRAFALELTKGCNLRCGYCYYADRNEAYDPKARMTREVAERSVDLLLERKSTEKTSHAALLAAAGSAEKLGQALVEGGRMADYWNWLSLAVAFDVIFGTVCTLAFEYVIEE